MVYFNFTWVVAVALVVGIIFQSLVISFPISAAANVGKLGCFEKGVVKMFMSDSWLPDGYSQIFGLYLFGPSGLRDYGSATLRCKI